MVPITLLASPSATLRDDVLRMLAARRPSLGVVRYDLDSLTGRPLLDRLLLSSSGPVEHVQLDPGDCLTCCVRRDVVDACEELHDAGTFTQIVVGLPAAVTPSALDSAFVGADRLVLAGTAVVVDALLLLEQVSGDELLVEYGLAAGPTDRRSLAELVTAQLSEADVLAVAQLARSSTSSARTVESLLDHLAPLACRVLLSPGGVGCEELVDRQRGWRAGDERREQLTRLAVDLLCDAHGVSTTVWETSTPLVPERLHEALGQVIDGVVRSTGELRLVGRSAPVLWSSAGRSVSVGLDPVRTGETASGSRLSLTGVGVDRQRLLRLLDSCVLQHEETGPFTDAFAAALGDAAPAVPDH